MNKNVKWKEKYYINKKTHLATEKFFVVHHSLKIKQGGPNKLRRGEDGDMGRGMGVKKHRHINKRPKSLQFEPLL